MADTFVLTGFWSHSEGAYQLCFDVSGSPHLLRLSVARGRSRFWAVDPEGFLDDVALPRPERWGFLAHDNGFELARQLREVSRGLIRDFEASGVAPETQDPAPRPGPSYLSPGA